MTSAATTQAPLIGCTTCGRVTSTPSLYVRRGPDVIVQGLRLATCIQCLSDPAPLEDTQCDGRCKGTYTTEIGTYHELRWRTVGGKRSHLGWACWDITCVEDWMERSWVWDDHTIESGIHTVVDGEYID